MAGWGKSHPTELCPGFSGTQDRGFYTKTNHFAQEQILSGLEPEFDKISQENAARATLLATTVGLLGLP